MTHVARRAGLAFATLLAAPAASAADPPYTVTVDLTRDIHVLGKDDLLEEEPSRRRLSALGDAAVPALARALRDEPPPVRAGVAEVLREIGTRATVEPLLGAVDDPSPAVRAAALAGLLPHDGPAIDAAVARRLDDEDPEVRGAAARGCAAHCRSDAAIGRLVALGAGDASPVVTRHARSAIAAIRTANDGRWEVVRQAIDRLPTPGAAGTSSEATVRIALLQAEAGRPQSLPVLTDAVGRPNLGNLRLASIAALAAHGDARAVDPLAGALRDSDPTVRIYAAASLEALAARGVQGAAAALATYSGPRVAADRLPAL